MDTRRFMIFIKISILTNESQYENADIFPIFGAAQLGLKTRCPAETKLFRGSPIHGINLIKVLWQLRQKRVRHYAGEAWDGQLCRREQPGRSDADGFHSAPVGGLDTCG